MQISAQKSTVQVDSNDMQHSQRMRVTSIHCILNARQQLHYNNTQANDFKVEYADVHLFLLILLIQVDNFIYLFWHVSKRVTVYTISTRFIYKTIVVHSFKHCYYSCMMSIIYYENKLVGGCRTTNSFFGEQNQKIKVVAIYNM